MHLTAQQLADTAPWREAGIALPGFDREAMLQATRQAPAWVHFGAGNIFRAFPAALQQRLLEEGRADTGVVVAEGYDCEIIDLLQAHDNLTLLVTLKVDGSIGKTVIGSVAETLRADTAHPDFARLEELFRAPSLQMVSFTITEKGYALGDGDRHYPDVLADLEAGPAAPRSYMGKLAALCHQRFLAGGAPLALVSMDNCSHNGDRLRGALTVFSRGWAKRGLADPAFADYLEDPARVSFPWSMIDKITPRPDESVQRMLADCGFADHQGAATAKHTYLAPFVNAEETQYLVVEDHFPNGRPPLEAAGVIFTDRETVDKVERMKVCTCLNPLHTALAVFGCLLGFSKISDEMQDVQLVALIKALAYREGLPVVVNPGILDPAAFLRNVLEVRLPNPFLPDTPQRIATDTSQKLAIRFGETIKAYMTRPGLDPAELEAVPLVLAGWLRYLLGVDDRGEPMELSPDPRAGELRAQMQALSLGDTGAAGEVLAPILADAGIFGVSLREAGLADKVLELFVCLSAGPGAVRKVLEGAC